MLAKQGTPLSPSCTFLMQLPLKQVGWDFFRSSPWTSLQNHRITER